MSEPLRRRVRARLLAGLSHVGEWLPRPLLQTGVACTARMLEPGVYGQRARTNLRTAYGNDLDEGEIRNLVHGVFQHSGRLFTEWLRLARCRVPEAPGMGPDPSNAWLEESVLLDASFKMLQGQIARGRGVILVTPHLGNWELLAARLRHAGIDGAVVGRKRARDSSSDWMVRMRQAYGVTTIPQDASPRRSLEVLKAGGVLGLLPDLEVRRLAGEFVPFFGVPALTMTAPAALARAHGVPLLPARCVLPRAAKPSDPYTLSFGEPLEIAAGLERRAATLDLTRRLAEQFELWIRETPEQWAWHQHRWRTRPGEIESIPLAERQRRKRTAGERDKT
ncbi:MAG: lauroyl/myristoyl acyltransferase [Chlamydiales bacterium]